MEIFNKDLMDNIRSKKPVIPIGDRLIEDHSRLLDMINILRSMGLIIVYTMGTWDLFHIGHGRYFRAAKEHGDVLLVGIDADEYIKKHKGPDRPVVPYDERWETVVDHRSVDIATILRTQTANDELVQLIRPDVVVLSFSSAKEDLPQYEERMKKKYGLYCKEVVILPRQAETSTSAKIRLVIINGAKPLLDLVHKFTDDLRKSFEEFFNSKQGSES